MNLAGKKVTVLGLGDSGLEAARFLSRRGACVWVSEQSSNDYTLKRASVLAKEGIPHEVGTHTMERILDASFIVISPGIKPTADIYTAIKKAQIDILSEIELAARFFDGDIVAVTGTDGKTTTTTLIKEILVGCGHPAITCGNIGNPFIGEIDRMAPGTIVVIEVSSFQLYHTTQFHPRVAVLLNIAPDHLDWHYNIQDYIDAKARMFTNQTPADFAILNFGDGEIQKLLCKINAQKLFFNQFPTEFDANRDAAMHICPVYGIDRERAASILRSFNGVEHRLERVPTADGITYINDSKSTSLHSLEWGLNTMKGRTILICGGRNKGLDFTTMREMVHEKVAQVVVIGEATDVILKAWDGAVPCTAARNLEDALRTAKRLAQQGDTVLFSPACASFDMFLNYKQRGKIFKELVHRIGGGA